MIKRVFETLKEDSRKGDFIYQTKSDKIALNIDLSDEEIQAVSKGAWKNFLDKKTKAAAFILDLHLIPVYLYACIYGPIYTYNGI